MAETGSEQRRERLVEVFQEASVCTKCPLAGSRTKVVFGAGDADADLMFVGEAPGAEEDRQGLPFVGRAGGLLNELLAGIDLSRDQVFVANVLKCLRYRSQVQLADGRWERIGRLVRSRYDGEVMSVASDGSLARRKVVGWHATPLGDRSVYRLTYRGARRAGAGKVSVELTGDHPVLTDRGFVPAGELAVTDRVATGQGLTELEFDVVCGTLLGDGSIARARSSLSFGHSRKQLAYCRFKADLLEALDMRVTELGVAAVAGGPAEYDVVHARSLASRALRLIRAEFYAPVKRVPSWIADRLTPRMLAFWFMDDGHMRVRGGGRRPLAEIATNAFDDSDLQALLRGLDRLGLPAKALRGRIYFDTNVTERLSRLIAPFVHQSMRHKVSPEIEADVPFDANRFRPGPTMTLFDDVDVAEVTDLVGADRTFFCIDVEGTHNFVTAGGVVHNCRPPGNRDPEAEEIASCRPYLESQVELIEPTVIATLGNFATKLLTGSRTGITKVRGTPQLHRLGGRSVFIYPLLHPAAALRTPSLVETLREDFARIPELVAAGPPELERPEEGSEEGEPPADPADQLGLFG